MTERLKAELVADCRNSHGEGILWSVDHGLVMWTDITGKRFFTHDPAKGVTAHHDLPGRLCCFAPLRNAPWHRIMAAFSDGFAEFDVVSGERIDIAAFEPGNPETRLNDGRTDAVGRLVAGGMDEGQPTQYRSSVWVLDADRKARLLFDGVSCANSICFSPDGGTLYFADSPTGRIEAFDYDIAKGMVSGRRLLVQTNGIPDGSCVDEEGYLWNAVWEGGRIERYSPEGRLDRIIDVPVHKPTCCAFGGADRDILFITTSRLGTSDARLAQEPQAGGLYACRVGVRGLAAKPFG